MAARPAYDNSAQAAGGLWSINGFPDRPPVRVGTIIGDLSATLYAVIGTLAALRHAEKTGEGQMVDVSQQDSVLSLTENAVVSYAVDGKVPGPLGNEHPFVKPYELYPCQDGFVFFGGYTDKFWRLSCHLFGQPELADDPEIDTMAKRFEPEVYERRIRPLLHKWFEDKTKAELEEIVGDAVPLSAIKDIAEVVEDPQIAARDMVVDVDYPDFGGCACSVRPSSSAARPPSRAVSHRRSASTPAPSSGHWPISTSTTSPRCARRRSSDGRHHPRPRRGGRDHPLRPSRQAQRADARDVRGPGRGLRRGPR
ncbi:CaiB/BaiF CoA transferase family protein [Actinomadura madurae]|uniref:CaiB/BaiF CoA transferase family protein n=1 Tax=Actinomadura madurae TaxID=1993 RepID=UPI0020D22DD8|nr:CoA transferase [Actinomadura madurae]